MDQYKLKKIKIKFKQYVLILVFFALLSSLLILVLNQVIYGKVGQLKEKQKQRIILENRISNFDKLKNEYETISSDVNYINNLLPIQDGLINIINAIEANADENHIELSIKFKSEPSGHKLQTNFIAKGYFNDVMNFYQKLATGKILVYITAINITDQENLLDNAKAEIQTEVYFD